MSLKSRLFVTTSTLVLLSQFRGSSVLTQLTINPSGPSHNRSTFITSQVASYPDKPPSLRTADFITQYIQTSPEEPNMATVIFPELKGLSWDVHLKPQFSTKIAVHTSGAETRTSYWEQPIYDIELTYDYLPNYNGTNTDLKKLLGFFNNRFGSFEEFLYKMKDFNRVEDRVIMQGNGLAVEVVLTDLIADYEQPIGQVDPDSLSVHIDLSPQSIPAGADAVLQLPYPNNVTIAQVIRNTNVYVPVTTTPVGFQYKFNPMTGRLTFPAGEANNTFDITYTAELQLTTGYTVQYPNSLLFETAPPTGSTIRAAYEYWFIVRFTEDQQDFDTFSERLWELQELHLRTVIL